MILDCAGGKCSCQDMVSLNKWEREGTCVAKNMVDYITKEGNIDDKEKRKRIGDAGRTMTE